MAKKSKGMAASAARYDRDQLHDPKAALELVKSMSFVKFDEGVDVAFVLGIDPKKADENVRGTVSMPHGTGRTVRVAVFTDGEKHAEAEAAGADIVGGKDLADEILAGRTLDFDVTIATPSMMPHVGKLGQILGPRGLMPNPKTGTVTNDVGKTIEAFKAGRVEYRNDRYGNIHAVIGRVSFGIDQLLENLASITDELNRAKPAGSKGRYIRKIGISSTMGPGVKVDPGALEDLVKSYR